MREKKSLTGAGVRRFDTPLFFLEWPKLKAMMDLAQGEFHPVGMTNAPIATHTATHTAKPDDEKTVRRTPLADRKKAVAPVQLHRDEGEHVGAATETFGACKRACQGMAYDLKHWNDLPAEGAVQRAQLVATRGGRLPYLVLTVSVAFLVFFLVMHAVKWVARGSGRRQSLVMYSDAPPAPQAAAAPRPPAPRAAAPLPQVVPPAAAPPPNMVPLVGPSNMPRSFA